MKADPAAPSSLVPQPSTFSLQTFFEKFDLFADAPDAVVKMRELVLELAVQGKVTSALASDGTVPSIVEFRETAATLANSLGLRSPKASIEEAEPSFDVPSHWRWMALADIGVAQTGTTPSKANHDAFNGNVPFIKPADILPNSINYSNESLSRHGAESGSRIAPSGSLLMVCIGTIGKCNLIERECAFNQQINSLTPVDAVDSRYLLVAARSRSFQDAAWKKSSSTTIAILNKGKWLSIPVPLPPLAEQKRIVAKVDELMALCDRLEAQQQERETRHAALARASLARFADAPTPANLHFLFHRSYAISPADLRQSILTLAVQGKLVPQDPSEEPTEEFLNRTMACHAQSSSGSKSRRERGMVAIAEAEIPFSIPDSWAWCRLETIADKVTDGEHLSPVKTVSGMPLLTATQVTARGVILNIPQYVSVEDGYKFRQRCDPTRGDVLICSRGTIGRCAVVETDEVFCLMGSVILVRFPAESSPRYFNYFLSTDFAQAEMRGMSGATAVKALYLKDIRQSLVPIPPLAEQRRIVAKVDQLMTLVDELEARLAASRATAANLLSALVSELTSQA